MPDASSASSKSTEGRASTPCAPLTAEQLREGERRNERFIRLCIEEVRQHAGEQAAQELIAELLHHGFHG